MRYDRGALRVGLRPQLQQALVVSGRASTITALLDRGADPDESWHGMSAYKVAVRFGRDEAAAVLAARGADTSTVNDHDRAIGACVAGRTPPPVRGPIAALARTATSTEATRSARPCTAR